MQYLRQDEPISCQTHAVALTTTCTALSKLPKKPQCDQNYHVREAARGRGARCFESGLTPPVSLSKRLCLIARGECLPTQLPTCIIHRENRDWLEYNIEARPTPESTTEKQDRNSKSRQNHSQNQSKKSKSKSESNSQYVCHATRQRAVAQ